jgi:hypothetical protein
MLSLQYSSDMLVVKLNIGAAISVIRVAEVVAMTKFHTLQVLLLKTLKNIKKRSQSVSVHVLTAVIQLSAFKILYTFLFHDSPTLIYMIPYSL